MNNKVGYLKSFYNKYDIPDSNNVVQNEELIFDTVFLDISTHILYGPVILMQLWPLPLITVSTQ